MPTREATIDDLYRSPAKKAELVNGEVVEMPPTGWKPGNAAFRIALRLHEYGERTGRGRAVTDGVAFMVDLPNRKSFCPDAAFHAGEPTMQFAEGAPCFAVEVRSEGDYGPAAERRLAAKRTDYFAAGTLVVWDVDLVGEDVVRAYRAPAPESAAVFRRGGTADAEPALPGWTMAVDELFV